MLSVLAAALIASPGCRTRSYYDLPWDDVTGRKRDRAALDADDEKCRAERQRAFLQSEGASAATGRVVEQAGSDTTFLACMERSGWKPGGDVAARCLGAAVVRCGKVDAVPMSEVTMTSSTLVRPVHAPAGSRASSASASEIPITGRGATLEGAFEDAAAATFALLADVDRIRPERTIPVSFIEHEHGLALARWLELLLDAAREHHLVFGEFHLQRERDRWWGCATGERRRAPLLRDVRIARARPAVTRTAEGWEARCLAHCSPPTPAVDQRARAPE